MLNYGSADYASMPKFNASLFWLVACNRKEVPAYLVVAADFKSVGTYVNRKFGGFDSHALPLLIALTSQQRFKPAKL